MPNNLEKFVSKNKRSIILPVPYGTTVYEFKTGCKNSCYLLPQSVAKDLKLECSYKSLCHTEYKGVRPIKLDSSNWNYVMAYWQDTIFDTATEAEYRGMVLTGSHRRELHRLVSSRMELIDPGPIKSKYVLAGIPVGNYQVNVIIKED